MDLPAVGLTLPYLWVNYFRNVQDSDEWGYLLGYLLGYLPDPVSLLPVPLGIPKIC